MIKCIFQVNSFLIFGTLIREVKQQLTRNDLNHYGFGFLTQIWKILLCGNKTQFKKHKLRIKPRNLNCIVNLDWFDHFNLKRAFNAVSAKLMQYGYRCRFNFLRFFSEIFFQPLFDARFKSSHKDFNCFTLFNLDFQCLDREQFFDIETWRFDGKTHGIAMFVILHCYIWVINLFSVCLSLEITWMLFFPEWLCVRYYHRTLHKMHFFDFIYF